MDPDAALKEIREIYNGPSDNLDYERLLELIVGLDDWLSKGGFLPEAWDRKK